MAGGRVLAVLGTLVLGLVAAGVWMVLEEPSGPADGTAPPADTDAAERPAPPTDTGTRTGGRRHAKQKGSCGVLGVVRRREGSAPAAGQVVTLLREGEEPWTAAADESGAFLLGGLPPGGPYELRVEAKGCATVRLPGLVLDRDEQRDVGTLWIDRAVPVKVKVRTLADEPVEGALVEAFAAPDATREAADVPKTAARIVAEPVAVSAATTGSDGLASFPEMATGVWTFRASKAGLARTGRASVRVESGATPPEIVIWMPSGHSLAGRVLDGDKKPVAGALVLGGRQGSLWDTASGPLRARATSDAEGKWQLTDLPTGDVWLAVGRAGGVPFQAAVVRIPEVKSFDLFIRDGGRLEGAVTDAATGAPLEGAVVRVSATGTAQRTAEATTDAQGRYAVDPVPEGTIGDISVQKSGWIQDRSEEMPWGRQMSLQPGDKSTRDLRMRRGATVTGQVTGPSGPVASARVTVWVGTPDRGVVQAGPVFTDSEGKFSVGPAERGTAVVSAQKEGLVQREFPQNVWAALQQGNVPPQIRVDVPEAGEVKADVRLAAGARIEGRVEGAGAPLGGVDVTATGVFGQAAATTRTRDDGTFALEGATPGAKVSFSLRREGWVPARNEAVDVAAEGPTTGVVLRMVKQKVVRGTVTSASGAPLRDAQAMLVLGGGRGRAQGDFPFEMNDVGTFNRGNFVQGGTVGEPVAVHADGTYELPIPVAEGQVAVRAVALGHAPGVSSPVELTEGRDEYQADVALDDGYAVRGRVASAGVGVAGANVTLNAGRQRGGPNPAMGAWQGNAIVAVTGADGAFAVEHVPTGTYVVTATADGYVAKNVSDVKVPTAGDVAIDLDAALEITGRVSFADGAPAAGAIVTAQKEQAGRSRDMGWWGGTQAIAGPDGGFRVRGLAPGSYQLQVIPPWDGSVNLRPLTQPGVSAGSSDVKLVVDAGAVISGRVVDEAKKPVAMAWVYGNPTDGNDGSQWRGARTKSDGTFEMAGIGNSPYHLNANPPQTAAGAELRGAVLQNVAPGTRDLEIVLPAGLRIEGTIVDAQGRPLSQAQLWIQAKAGPSGTPQINGNSSWSTTDVDGRFRFIGLGEGRYVVALQSWQSGAHEALLLQGADDLAAGTTDARIVAVEGDRLAGVVVDESGQAVAGAWVNVWSKNGNVGRQARSDAQGRFEVKGLPRGTVNIQAQAPGRPPASLEAESSSTVVRVVLVRGATLSGRVIASDGSGYANQNVMIRQTEGGKHSAWARTDGAGNFKAEAIPPGTYEVSIWRPKADGNGAEQVSIGSARTDEPAELRIP